MNLTIDPKNFDGVPTLWVNAYYSIVADINGKVELAVEHALEMFRRGHLSLQDLTIRLTELSAANPLPTTWDQVISYTPFVFQVVEIRDSFHTVAFDENHRRIKVFPTIS